MQGIPSRRACSIVSSPDASSTNRNSSTTPGGTSDKVRSNVLAGVEAGITTMTRCPFIAGSPERHEDRDKPWILNTLSPLEHGRDSGHPAGLVTTPHRCPTEPSRAAVDHPHPRPHAPRHRRRLILGDNRRGVPPSQLLLCNSVLDPATTFSSPCSRSSTATPPVRTSSPSVAGPSPTAPPARPAGPQATPPGRLSLAPGEDRRHVPIRHRGRIAIARPLRLARRRLRDPRCPTSPSCSATSASPPAMQRLRLPGALNRSGVARTRARPPSCS